MVRKAVQPARAATQLPYRQSYQYDQFNNMTQRNNLHWGIDYWHGQNNNLSYNYNPANNRIAGWEYDADGRVVTSNIPDAYSLSTYDARGLLSRLNTVTSNDVYRYYDGNGREAKRKTLTFIDQSTEQSPTNYWWEDEGFSYYIRSSILGNEVISEVSRYGDKIKTIVRGAGNVIATQENHITYEQVMFEHRDASGSSYKTSDRLGYVNYADGTTSSPGELDPMGNNIGLETPYIELQPPNVPNEINNEPFMLDQGDSMMVNGQRATCEMDGMAVPCGMAMNALRNGSAVDAGTDPFLLAQLGILKVERTVEHRTLVPNPQSPDFLIENVTTSVETEYLFGSMWEYERELDKDEVKQLRGIVEKLTKNKKCAAFIKQLLETASGIAPKLGVNFRPTGQEGLFETNVLNIFDKVAKDGSFSFGKYNTISGTIKYGEPLTYVFSIPSMNGTTYREKTITLSSDDDRPKVSFSFASYFPRGPQDPGYGQYRYAEATKRRFFSESGGGFTALHELLHFNFHDVYLASAVAIMKGDKNAKFPTLSMATEKDTNRASKYWNDELKVHCDPNYKPPTP